MFQLLFTNIKNNNKNIKILIIIKNKHKFLQKFN